MTACKAIYKRFTQFGGIRLLRQYARMGVLRHCISECIRCIVCGDGITSAYAAFTKTIDAKLAQRYRPHIYPDTTPPAEYPHKHTVWFCWLQGLDNAPTIIHSCLHSIKRNIPDCNIVVITQDNYSEWTTLPPYIIEKYQRGFIPPALFSDLIRLDLLITHGGTWIDASVLCTGCNYWEPILRSKLFLFRYYTNDKITGISNWFIHAAPDCGLLKTLRDMLHDYWRDHNCVVEYYIFHLFFGIAAVHYPETISRMPKGNSYAHTLLGKKLHQAYDPLWWQRHISQVDFHKLNYRNADKATLTPDSYYHHIIAKYD